MKKKFNKRMLLLNIPLCPKVNASAVITITPTLVDWPHTTAINTKRSSTTSVESAAMFLIHQRIFNSIGRGGIRTHEASVAAVEDDVMDIDDEAVMLEAAMFGGIPEGSGYRLPFAPHHLMQNGLNRGMDPYAQRMPRPPSPSLTAKGLLREQQDDEYFASLQTGRENELKAKEEAEAALAERRKEEQLRKKLEEQEIDRQLVAKEASLPQEPTSDDENAITLLVRMPDGSRGGRRFLKSDRLQYLFDFIDIGKGVKSGMYRLVRPYPRRAFSDGESALTLNELGLTSKQEALFLELI